MQPAAHAKNGFTLTAAQNVRLQNLAPLFGLEFRWVDGDCFAMRDVALAQGPTTFLPASVAHRRLLAEICSRGVKWTHFHFGKSCRDSLLEQSDARLERIAELYALDVALSSVEPDKA